MSNSEPTKPVDVPTEVAAQPTTSQHGPVTLGTLVSYLLGSREAILTLASHRDTVGLGLIFVLSAAFAREYDGEDLLHEPWHLLLPLVASLATSFVLFCLVDFVARCRGTERTGFLSRYRSFLGLYWMTAPVAWLYAIPFERFLTAGEAAAANLWLLALVSLWRVLLITRVLSVLYSPCSYAVSFASFFCLVMLFADTVAIGLVSAIDMQVFVLMGGVRMTDAENVLAGAKFLVLFFGVVSWPIWALGSLVVAQSHKTAWTWSGGDVPSVAPIGRSVWSLVAASLVVWCFVLPWTQPSQQLRGEVERATRAGRFREALNVMSAHQPADFPPHWNPPPRIGFNHERPRILKVIAALKPDDAPWVRQLYFDKLDAALGRHHFPMFTLWAEADVGEILDALAGLPEGEHILRYKRDMLYGIQQHANFITPEGRLKIDTTLLRLATPPPDGTTGEWTEPTVIEWHQFLDNLDRIENRQLVLEAHEARLRRLMESAETPEAILVRVRRLLKTESTAE